MMTLSPASTALVLIDLQRGILGRPLHPRSADAVVTAARALAERARAAGVTVVQVCVNWTADGGDQLAVPVDAPLSRPVASLPADWAELAEGLAAPGDIRITKRQWGAFYGTDLDLQLRRRGIRHIILGGVATNFGVESTARSAWEHGYAVVLAEDVCACPEPDMHAFAITRIFPRISRVSQSGDIQFAP